MGKRLPDRVRLAELPRSRLVAMLAEVRSKHGDNSSQWGLDRDGRRKQEDLLWAIYYQQTGQQKVPEGPLG